MSLSGAEKDINECLDSIEKELKDNEPPDMSDEKNMFHLHNKRGARQIFKQLSRDVQAELGEISKKMRDWPLKSKEVSNEDYEKILKSYLDELMPLFNQRIKKVALLIGSSLIELSGTYKEKAIQMGNTIISKLGSLFEKLHEKASSLFKEKIPDFLSSAKASLDKAVEFAKTLPTAAKVLARNPLRPN